MGGGKRGGRKTSRMTPLPKRGFGPPLVRYVFHPPQVSVLCFSCTKLHHGMTEQKRTLLEGSKMIRRARSLVRFPPPIRLAPPHITVPTSLTQKVGEFTPTDNLRFSGHMFKDTLVVLSVNLKSIQLVGPDAFGRPWVRVGCATHEDHPSRKPKIFAENRR